MIFYLFYIQRDVDSFFLLLNKILIIQTLILLNLLLRNHEGIKKFSHDYKRQLGLCVRCLSKLVVNQNIQMNNLQCTKLACRQKRRSTPRLSLMFSTA